jgi:hypothetical protein
MASEILPLPPGKFLALPSKSFTSGRDWSDCWKVVPFEK